MKQHAPNDACNCNACHMHREWLRLHLRALAEHKAQQEAKYDPLLS